MPVDAGAFALGNASLLRDFVRPALVAAAELPPAVHPGASVLLPRRGPARRRLCATGESCRDSRFRPRRHRRERDVARAVPRERRHDRRLVLDQRQRGRDIRGDSHDQRRRSRSASRRSACQPSPATSRSLGGSTSTAPSPAVSASWRSSPSAISSRALLNGPLASGLAALSRRSRPASRFPQASSRSLVRSTRTFQADAAGGHQPRWGRIHNRRPVPIARRDRERHLGPRGHKRDAEVELGEVGSGILGANTNVVHLER